MTTFGFRVCAARLREAVFKNERRSNMRRVYRAAAMPILGPPLVSNPDQILPRKLSSLTATAAVAEYSSMMFFAFRFGPYLRRTSGHSICDNRIYLLPGLASPKSERTPADLRRRRPANYFCCGAVA